MAENKKYTFMNMKRAIGKNGNYYVGVTLECMVCNPRPIKAVKDKLVLNFSTPIYSRGKYIEYLCGMAPEEDSDGTVWAQVGFWQSGEKGLATRLEKLLESRSDRNLILIVTGSISVTQAEGDQGRIFTNVKIAADDFQLIRSVERKDPFYQEQTPLENDSASKKLESGKQTAQHQQAPESGYGGFGQFYDVDDDDDLPF